MIKKIILCFIYFITFLMCVLIRPFIWNKKKKVVFGTSPIINNKYWSCALKEMGVDSVTLMSSFYSINDKSDYDIYFDDLVPQIFRTKILRAILKPFFVWFYIIRNAKVMVMPFSGVIYNHRFYYLDYLLFKTYNIKVVSLSYGSDSYMYSKVRNLSLQHALLISYPQAARIEKLISKKVYFWCKYSDIVLGGFMQPDGFPRWDILISQFLQIDVNEWRKNQRYSIHDGINGAVKILHTPNHRGFKGTEFLLNAVNQLKQEGFKLELVLLEKVENKVVKETMQHVDILAEQFIATGYAMSGLEGMASGLPVMANLDDQDFLKVFRRYSFLNECPILSTSVETIKENLKLLITNPMLRQELGALGRQYVEKYHSYKTAQYLFGAILRKLDGEDVDLIDLFHPLKSEYVKTNYIKVPKINRFKESEKCLLD